MPYLTLDDIRAYRGIGSTATADDAILLQCIGQAQGEIERICGRSFETSTDTCYYKADSIIDLPIGSQYSVAGGKSWDRWGGTANANNAVSVLWLGKDLLSIDTLTNGDETVISSTSYWLEPRNSTTAYQYIRLRSDESWVFNTDGEISVEGSWGYTTGPDDVIKGLALELAAYLYDLRKSQTWDTVASPEYGVITIPKGWAKHAQFVLESGGYLRALGPW